MSSQTSKVIHRESFSMKDLKCESVVVYGDRAECKRNLKVKLKKGENEIVLTGISNSIDSDSVRVEGFGDAMVLDVICQRKKALRDEIDQAEHIKKLRGDKQQLDNELEELRKKLERVGKQSDVLDLLADNISNAGLAQEPADSAKFKSNVKNFLAFLDGYGQNMQTSDKQKLDLEAEIKATEEKLKVMTANLNNLEKGNQGSDAIEIIILLETSMGDVDLSLTVSYVVFESSWSPKYDIRVNSHEKSMTIGYYGLVSQCTSEDWLDCKLKLSTAVPSIGGNPPELNPIHVNATKLTSVYSSGRFGKREANKKRGISLGGTFSSYSLNMPRYEIKEQNTQLTTSSIGSTCTFDVTKNANIPADGKIHKVLIAIVEMRPEFSYESAPSKSPHAYLKSKVINTSSYTLLAGPANIFLDSNFVAKSQIKSCSPQEELVCSLGVDSNIKIDYKPIRKFNSHSGVINKTVTTTYIQIIEIANRSKSTVNLLLHEQYPASTNDNIKINLIEPVLKNNTSVKLNDNHNLEFSMSLSAAATEKITVKYTIEYPSEREIQFNDMNNFGSRFVKNKGFLI